MRTKRKTNLLMLVLSGLLAALVTVTTMFIPIPTPTKGYINLGDCFVNISAWLLGPIYGAGAAGIGSAIADLLLGYTVYAPATFVIKALMAAVSFHVFRVIAKGKRGFLARIAASVSAELVMICGYCIFECFLYQSFAIAVTGLPSNIAQGVGGVIISVTLYEALLGRIPAVNAIVQRKNRQN